MMFAFLVTLREGFEIALIVAIVMGYLARTGNRRHFRQIWIGVALAALVTVGVSTALVVGRRELSAAAREVFEGVTMLLATGMLTWMVLWMRRQAASLGTDLRHGVEVALHAGSVWTLVALAFSAVIREGIETALFLFAGSAAAHDDSSTMFVAGGLAGFAAAAVLGYGVYRGAHILPNGRFFTVSGVVVLILGAGLLSNGLGELLESGLIPSLGARPWDTEGWLPLGGVLGRFARAVLGYDSAPTWGQIIAYWAYLAAGLAMFSRAAQPVSRVPVEVNAASGTSGAR